MTAVSDYVAHGMALVPIPLGQKGPVTSGWNKSNNAITSINEVSLIAGNVGLAHAYCSPSPTMALDIDNLDAATFWLAKRQVALDELLKAEDAVQINSGKKGRAKLLYRLPLAVNAIETMQISDIFTGEMVLELRCASRSGLTVQDVLPPSIHPDTGKPYQWGGTGSWRNLPLIPADLLDLWQIELGMRAQNRWQSWAGVKSGAAIEDTPRKRAQLIEMLGYISADCSYDLYRDIVWAILSTGWQDADTIAEGWCLTAAYRFEETSYTNLVFSFEEARAPTFASIIYHARKGGWNG